MVRHPKFNKWLPPGGHLEPGEIPHLAAIREVLEETGVKVEIISRDDISFSADNAESIPRPFHILLETLNASSSQPAHQHIDLLFEAKAKSTRIVSSEGLDVRWMTIEEIESIEESMIFNETRVLAKQVIQSFQAECIL